MLEQFGRYTQNAAYKLHVRSALNPLLWLTAIATPICFGAAYAFRETHAVHEALIYVGLLPIVISCVGFCYFAICKPEKLQSEDYQLRHESLQLIQQKSGQIPIPAASLEQIVNPGLLRQEEKGVLN